MNTENNQALKSPDTGAAHTQLFLTGAMLFANLDFSSLGDYALKAAVGGAIWMGFKLAGDFFSNRMKRKQ